MPNLDLIEASLARPMDWGKVESMVCEILLQDDFPRLRKLGGVGDEGSDAVEEAFLQDEQRIETVVQITSEKAQVAKFKRTVKRLLEAKVAFDELTIVYRDPVTNEIRRDIRAAARESEISVDIRDQSYLTGQLGKLENGIFARYFQDIRTQVDQLLNEGDPLRLAESRLFHAMLASLGAYVTNPRAKAAQSTLFDRTVLAALVAAGTKTAANELVEAIRLLLPGEDIQPDRVSAALGRLHKQGLCEFDGQAALPTDASMESVGAALLRIRGAFDSMLSQLIKDVGSHHKLSDAQRGYLDRNLRRALAYLVRLIKPTESMKEDAVTELQHGEHKFRSLLADGLNSDVSRTAITSLVAYARNSTNSGPLATLARSYAALGLRNMDPLGKRWQLATLSRSAMLLDADAVLYLLIEELPEHSGVHDALDSLEKEGVRLMVPLSVLRQAVEHIGRAWKTYRKFGASIDRMTPEMVDSRVWHALVRGFYYAGGGETAADFQVYLSKYFDVADPVGYGRFLLEGRIKCEIVEKVPVSDGDEEPFTSIVESVLAKKEPERMKARFRDEEQMKERAEEDVAIALYAATIISREGRSGPVGYVVSNDSVFGHIESRRQWGDRPQVHLEISAVLALAEWSCGARLGNEQLVNLIFNPVLAAAAEDIADELVVLAKSGVELRGVDPRRLEWDLSRGLQTRLFDYGQAEKQQSREGRIAGALAIADAASKLGYKIEPEIGEVVAEYNRILKEAADQRQKREEAEKFARRLADASSGLTKKGKRRINAIVREMGGWPVYDEVDDRPDAPSGNK
jgi:hypothetical protein